MSNRPEFIGWEPTNPALVEAPDSTKRATGWQFQEPPPHQIFNWFWRITGRWTRFLDGRTHAYDSVLEAMAEAGEGDVFTVLQPDMAEQFPEQAHPLDGYLVETGGGGTGWALTSNGDVVVAYSTNTDDDGDRLVCLDSEGKRWGADDALPGAAVNTFVCFGHEAVYVATNNLASAATDVILRKYALSDGELLWEETFPGAFTGIFGPRVAVRTRRASSGVISDRLVLIIGSTVFGIAGETGTSSVDSPVPATANAVHIVNGACVVLHDEDGGDSVTVFANPATLGSPQSFGFPDSYSSLSLVDTAQGCVIDTIEGTNRRMALCRANTATPPFAIIDNDIATPPQGLFTTALFGHWNHCDGRYMLAAGASEDRVLAAPDGSGGQLSNMGRTSPGVGWSDGAHGFKLVDVGGDTVIRVDTISARPRRYICTRLTEGVEDRQSDAHMSRNNRNFTAID